MTKTATRRRIRPKPHSGVEQERINAQRALVRAAKRERSIQALARRLNRLRDVSASELFVLARNIIEADGAYTMEPKRASAVNE